VAHVEYLDSLFFICLNKVVLNFSLIDYQVHFAIALMEGRASGFTKEDVSEWEAKRFRYVGTRLMFRRFNRKKSTKYRVRQKFLDKIIAEKRHYK
jgi:hypothetical protein